MAQVAGRGFNIGRGYDIGVPPPFPMPHPGQLGHHMGYGGIMGAPMPYYAPPAYAQQIHQAMLPSFAGNGQYARGAPITDGGFPGIHLKNASGGVGLAPHYNYLFPKEHVMIHVFTDNDKKPWQPDTVPQHQYPNHVKFMVPATMNIKEFMQQIGCGNDDPGKNILYECTEKGGGGWVSGLRIKGDDKDRMKKSLKEFGWDGSRGVLRPPVWVWKTDKGM